MKTIYEILYPFGGKTLEVAEDFETRFPYTEVVPDPDRDLMLQFFDVKSNVWKPVEFMANTEKLALLESFYTTVKEENTKLTDKQAQMTQLNAKLMLNDLSLTAENAALKTKADSLAQINSKTMLALVQNTKDIAAIKEQLKPVETETSETQTTENIEGGK